MEFPSRTHFSPSVCKWSQYLTYLQFSSFASSSCSSRNNTWV
jgi:hypothetical protein